MRWSCPHCGTNLTVPDEKLGSGWSFSRCFRCSAYSLVRKAEVNVIKVHGAPAGEKVVPTEGHEQQLMSQQAMQNYARYLQPNNSNPHNPLAHNPYAETQSFMHQQAIPSYQQASSPLQQMAQQMTQNQMVPDVIPNPNHLGVPAELLQIPEALSENTSKLGFALTHLRFDPRGKALPIAIAAAGFMAVSSGVYFYIQGQALLNRARLASNPGQQQTVASVSARAIVPRPEIDVRTQAIEAAANKISDRVSHQAMAPTRSLPEVQALDEADDDNEALTAVTPTISPMTIRIPIDRAKIRSGPGLAYPIVAYASPDQRYEIIHWSDRWFKIKVKTSAAVAVNSDKKVEGWIRNDLVQLLNGAPSKR